MGPRRVVALAVAVVLLAVPAVAAADDPKGTPGAIVEDRTWEDYSLGRDTVPAHLAALDLVYTGVITDLRKVIEQAGEIDPVTEDLLVNQAGDLEQFQWFVRAHLENAGGHLVHEGTSSEVDAADSARDL